MNERSKTMNDNDCDHDTTESNIETLPTDDAELQPLLGTCSSLIRRCIQYQPRTVHPKRESSDVASLQPWCLTLDGECSEEQRIFQQKWLHELARIQQESIFLRRLRSSLLQRNADAMDTSTQVLRSYGREMRDAQVAAVMRSQAILDEYEKQIMAVQEQIRQVQATNRRLLSDWVSPIAAVAPEGETISAGTQRKLKENRLLHGVILDLLPYVLSLENDGAAASRLHRYL
jgi:hypothetical protein